MRDDSDGETTSSSSSSSSGQVSVQPPIVLGGGHLQVSVTSSEDSDQDTLEATPHAIFSAVPLQSDTSANLADAMRGRTLSDGSSGVSSMATTPTAGRTASRPLQLGPAMENHEYSSEGSPASRTLAMDPIRKSSESQGFPGHKNTTSVNHVSSHKVTGTEPQIIETDRAAGHIAQQLKIQQEREQRRVQEEDTRKREMEARRLQEEKEAKRRDAETRAFKLHEEEESKIREEEARKVQLRKEEEATRRAEEARKVQLQEEQEAMRREEEEGARTLKLREAAFWSMLSPVEADRMRGMLQAVSLYQQQLQQNDNVLADLQESVRSKDQNHHSLKQRFQQAEQDSEQAQQHEEKAKVELARWSRKSEQYEGAGEDLAGLRSRHQNLQSELTRLRERSGPVGVEVTSLQEKLGASDKACSSMATRLVNLKAKCQQTVASFKAEHVEASAGLRAESTEELCRLEVEAQNYLGQLRVQHAEDVSKLRMSFDDVSRRRNKLRHERDLAADHFVEAQREGQRVQRQFADARQEVLEMSVQLKANSLGHSQRPLEAPRAVSRSHSMTHLGRSAPASPAVDRADHSLSISGIDRTQDSTQMDAELLSFRRRSKALEKQCARTHDALERKQSECDRWRRRSLEQRHHFNQSVVSGKPRPFTLGPMENNAALMLLSPHGTRAL